MASFAAVMSGEAPQPKGPDDKKPILISFIVFLGLLLGALADRVLGSVENRQAEAVSPLLESQNAEPVAPTAPAGLQDAVEQAAQGEAGRNGVLVRSVEDDWTAGFRGATPFSQGSLRRIWLGAALLDAVDRGELSLDQSVPMLAARRRGQQPREKIGELLRRAVATNDRQAQDHILDGLNGSPGMARWLEEKEIDEVSYGPAYRDLAKSGVRNEKERARGPLDIATPDGMAFGLSQLYAGKLLSSGSTQLLLSYFPTAQLRSTEAAAAWQVHTVAGEVRGANGRIEAASGAALIRSRTGAHFTIAVFAEGPADATGRRDRLLANALTALQRAETR